MGLFNSMANYAHKSELRESKDEIICGEVIRGMSHRDWRCHRIVAHSDRQQMGFKLPGDPVLSNCFTLAPVPGAIAQVGALMNRVKRHMRWVSLISGVLLIGIGLMMLSDTFKLLPGYFNWTGV